VEGQHLCTVCGLVELAGERLRRVLMDGLAARGINVSRLEPPD
jgi:hypothetical protein